MFLIDLEREGLDFTPIEKLGTNTLSSSMIFFDNVRVEADEVVGTLDDGWRELLDVLNTERIVTTAGLVGTSRPRAQTGRRLRRTSARFSATARSQPIRACSSRSPRHIARDRDARG